MGLFEDPWDTHLDILHCGTRLPSKLGDTYSHTNTWRTYDCIAIRPNTYFDSLPEEIIWTRFRDSRTNFPYCTISMASLDFKLEDAGAHSFEKKPSVMSTLKSKLGPGTYEPYKLAGKSGFAFNKVFPVLRDFLQPDTTLSLESAAQSILENLPENAPMSNQVYTFCTLCFELAEQIPYNHPSQVKFARLLEYMGQSTRVTQIDTSKVDSISTRPSGYYYC